MCPGPVADETLSALNKVPDLRPWLCPVVHTHMVLLQSGVIRSRLCHSACSRNIQNYLF